MKMSAVQSMGFFKISSVLFILGQHVLIPTFLNIQNNMQLEISTTQCLLLHVVFKGYHCATLLS